MIIKIHHTDQELIVIPEKGTDYKLNVVERKLKTG